MCLIRMLCQNVIAVPVYLKILTGSIVISLRSFSQCSNRRDITIIYYTFVVDSAQRIRSVYGVSRRHSETGHQ